MQTFSLRVHTMSWRWWCDDECEKLNSVHFLGQILLDTALRSGHSFFVCSMPLIVIRSSFCFTKRPVSLNGCVVQLHVSGCVLPCVACGWVCFVMCCMWIGVLCHMWHTNGCVVPYMACEWLCCAMYGMWMVVLCNVWHVNGCVVPCMACERVSCAMYGKYWKMAAWCFGMLYIFFCCFYSQFPCSACS